MCLTTEPTFSSLISYPQSRELDHFSRISGFKQNLTGGLDEDSGRRQDCSVGVGMATGVGVGGESELWRPPQSLKANGTDSLKSAIAGSLSH